MSQRLAGGCYPFLKKHGVICVPRDTMGGLLPIPISPLHPHLHTRVLWAVRRVDCHQQQWNTRASPSCHCCRYSYGRRWRHFGRLRSFIIVELQFTWFLPICVVGATNSSSLLRIRSQRRHSLFVLTLLVEYSTSFAFYQELLRLLSAVYGPTRAGTPLKILPPTRNGGILTVFSC